MAAVYRVAPVGDSDGRPPERTRARAGAVAGGVSPDGWGSGRSGSIPAGQPADLDDVAGVRRLDEQAVADVDAHVVVEGGAAEEDEVGRLGPGEGYGSAHMGLHRRPVREAHAELGVHVEDETRAVEAARGCRPGPHVRDAEVFHRLPDHGYLRRRAVDGGEVHPRRFGQPLRLCPLESGLLREELLDADVEIGEQAPARGQLVLDRRLPLAEVHLLLERLGAVGVDLPGERADIVLHGRDARHRLLVRRVDGAEVAQLRVRLSDVTEVEQDVEDAEAVALVHRRQPRAAQFLSRVQFRLGTVQVAARLLQADVEVVEGAACRVVPLGQRGGPAVEAGDLAADAARLRLEVLHGG